MTVFIQEFLYTLGGEEKGRWRAGRPLFYLIEPWEPYSLERKMASKRYDWIVYKKVWSVVILLLVGLHKSQFIDTDSQDTLGASHQSLRV